MVRRVHIRDKDLVKEVLTSKDFDKPPKLYKNLEFLGPNILTSKREEWKKHRRVCNPGFSRNAMVSLCEQTQKFCDLMIEGINKKLKNGEDTLGIYDYTTKLTLSVIISTGFGRDATDLWTENSSEQKESKKNTNGRLDIDHSFQILTRNLFLLMGFPSWFRKYFPFFGIPIINRGFNDSLSHLEEIVHQASESFDDKAKDIISLLVKANRSDSNLLTESEIKSDSFIFMLAGRKFFFFQKNSIFIMF